MHRIGLSFTVIPADVDEGALAHETEGEGGGGAAPFAYAVKLAAAKAASVYKANPWTIVIGADTIVLLDRRILGKPADRAEAAEMLRSLSGRRHEVVTGLAVAAPAAVISNPAAGPLSDAGFLAEKQITYTLVDEAEDEAVNEAVGAAVGAAAGAEEGAAAGAEEGAAVGAAPGEAASGEAAAGEGKAGEAKAHNSSPFLLLTTHEVTTVYFKKLSEREIELYLAGGEAMDKAGAYGIQGRAGIFVSRIEGCYFNVVGLPVPKLALLLGLCGLEMPPAGEINRGLSGLSAGEQ